MSLLIGARAWPGSSPASTAAPAITASPGFWSLSTTWRDRHAAFLTFARTLCFDLFVVSQGRMHDPSLGRRHRIKRDGSASILDTFRRTERQLLGPVEPALLIALDVYSERDVVSEGPAHHCGHDRLQVMQRRPTASDQEPCVLPEQIEYDRATGSVGIRVTAGVVDVDFNLDIHQVEQVLDDLARALSIFVIYERNLFARRSLISRWRGVFFSNRNLDPGLLGADAEDSSPALAKYDDVCVFEVDS